VLLSSLLEVVMSPRPDCKRRAQKPDSGSGGRSVCAIGFSAEPHGYIAEQAGLSKGALYLYYKSKDAIIAALLKYFFVFDTRNRQQKLPKKGSSPPRTGDAIC
jgi:DNA-binding transcriptional regulator YbjK